MTGGTFTTTIQAPPEKVWAVVADLGTHASWSPKAYTMEWTGGEPNQVGSTFHSAGWIPGNKHNENDVEITERVEPTRFAFNAKDPQGRVRQRVGSAGQRQRRNRGRVHAHVPEDARRRRGDGARSCSRSPASATSARG